MNSLLNSLLPPTIFISHSWSYSDSYDRLTSLLRSKQGFSYRDLSVPKNDPIHYAPNDTALYQAIKTRVDQSDIVLVLAGVYATHSKWINLEIRAARELGQGFLGFYVSLQPGYRPGKPILAIEEWGAERTSQVVKENANEIVGWNTDVIINAIRRLSRK